MKESSLCFGISCRTPPVNSHNPVLLGTLFNIATCFYGWESSPLNCVTTLPPLDIHCNENIQPTPTFRVMWPKVIGDPHSFGRLNFDGFVDDLLHSYPNEQISRMSSLAPRPDSPRATNPDHVIGTTCTAVLANLQSLHLLIHYIHSHLRHGVYTRTRRLAVTLVIMGPLTLDIAIENMFIEGRICRALLKLFQQYKVPFAEVDENPDRTFAFYYIQRVIIVPSMSEPYANQCQMFPVPFSIAERQTSEHQQRLIECECYVQLMRYIQDEFLFTGHSPYHFTSANNDYVVFPTGINNDNALNAVQVIEEPVDSVEGSVNIGLATTSGLLMEDPSTSASTPFIFTGSLEGAWIKRDRAYRESWRDPTTGFNVYGIPAVLASKCTKGRSFVFVNGSGTRMSTSLKYSECKWEVAGSRVETRTAQMEIAFLPLNSKKEGVICVFDYENDKTPHYIQLLKLAPAPK